MATYEQQHASHQANKPHYERIKALEIGEGMTIPLDEFTPSMRVWIARYCKEQGITIKTAKTDQGYRVWRIKWAR